MNLQSLSLILLAALAPGQLAAEVQSLDAAFADLAKVNSTEQSRAFQVIRSAPSQAPDLIVKHLEDSDRNVRIQCLLLIREMPDPKCFKSVVAHAQSDPDLLVRDYAIIALAEYKNSQAMDVLRSIALQPKGTERITAIRYISRVAKKQSMELMRHLIVDSDPRVQINAALELARYGDSRGKTLARQMLSNTDHDIRYAAVGTLRYVGDPEDEAQLQAIATDPKESTLVHFEALAALRQTHLKALPVAAQMNELAKALAEHNRTARRWAAEELARMGSDDATALLKRTASNPQHPGRVEAHVFLESMKTP